MVAPNLVGLSTPAAAQSWYMTPTVFRGAATGQTVSFGSTSQPSGPGVVLIVIAQASDPGRDPEASGSSGALTPLWTRVSSVGGGSQVWVSAYYAVVGAGTVPVYSLTWFPGGVNTVTNGLAYFYPGATSVVTPAVTPTTGHTGALGPTNAVSGTDSSNRLVYLGGLTRNGATTVSGPTGWSNQNMQPSTTGAAPTTYVADLQSPGPAAITASATASNTQYWVAGLVAIA